MADAAPPTARLISDAGAMIGESPVWQSGKVSWTDPVSRRLLRREQDGELRSIPTASSVWSLAALPEGALAGALEDRFCIVGPAGDVRAGPAAPIDPGCRFNDMEADRQGGLWVGMMHRGVLATRGAIFHARSPLDPPVRVAQGLGVPNGMKLSADGRTLFVVDTLERTLLAYAVDGGKLAEPTIVSDFLGLPGKPDGMTLGQDGGFWVAMWGGGCIVHLARDGAFLRRIDVPAPHVSSLCFAGDDRLLVTTSRMRLSLQALRDHPGSGGLFEVTLEPAER
jgi:sugar lactone lactonase YvrE